MGCDISLFVEFKDNSGKWHMVKKPVPTCVMCNKYPDEECSWCERSEVFIPRDYCLFTVLANVRYCSKGYDPIAEPRELPKDMSDELEEYFTFGGEDHHSCSYHILRCLKEYDWKEIYFEVFSDLLMPELEKLATEHGGDENVRIVFGFDN